MPHPAVGLDDYHCTMLDPKLTQGRMVTAAQVFPGRQSIVHHAIMFEVRGAGAAAARARDKATGGKGWTCFGGPGVADDDNDHGHWLGVWVPGKVNDAFPAGTGMMRYRDVGMEAPEAERMQFWSSETEEGAAGTDDLAAWLASIGSPGGDGSSGGGAEAETAS